ncbi:MAG: SpoIID/LytB domain-containing protein [Candidatus Amulumruptor caecigallinarius]|nr:SpoIID/LytB domain-containing protein [Candidatus Amulumruptor caecigallinarius]MCM1396796.1 SpoIID/LytB domain-containing protein [Candidatus Amulumruptor caecigallinarius]MCM1454509.1 SpoIID/LytB domain-containing protein [bacterium]
MNLTPTLHVGLMAAPEIAVTLHGEYADAAGRTRSGELTLSRADVGLTLTPRRPDATFTVRGMRIGIGYHWDSRRDLSFEGTLRVITEGHDEIRLVNDIDVERYLCSVITSEMSADASGALLRAHAVISRSWVMAQTLHRAAVRHDDELMGLREDADGDPEIIRWWDREDHEGFDVCADDHCQRYQGVTDAHRPEVEAAVADTAGLVLTDPQGALVDARFSKCCGGVTEEFGTCWSPRESHECLRAFGDNSSRRLPPLATEAEVRQWVTSRPAAFCAEATPATMRQVLRDYDQSTRDFYRWVVEYSGDQLAAIVSDRLPEVAIGRIRELRPLERGASGRISRLRIIGSEGSVTVGKELMVRRVLSPTHLYSSAFVVDHLEPDADRYPTRFVLRGAGWGHGVGLCQIGAAVMGERGYGWRDILEHYFPGSFLSSCNG